MGRDPGCDIMLDDPSASRRHARIVATPQGYTLEDLGSKNGTLVNDKPAPTARLKAGDVIMVGAVRVLFAEDAETPSTTSVVLIDEPPRRESASFTTQSHELSLPQRRLKMLYDLSGRLTSLRGADELLDDAMNICFDTLRFERGAIAVRKAGSRGVDWPVVRNLRGAQGELTISRTILGRALDHGERAIVNEGDAAEIDPTVSMVQHGIRSAMCAPLVHQDEILGVIYGDRVTTGTVYSDEDVDFLAGIARQVSIGLANSRLMEEQKALVRLENEIALAREIQQALFPARLPDSPSLAISALNEPGRHVSGDYYDVIELSGGRVGLLIADVTGEGMAASLLMANLQAAVRVTFLEGADPADLLVRWNRLVNDNTDESKFITCLLGIVDPNERTLRIACAGHPPPYLITLDPAKCAQLELDAGFPLGVTEDAAYVASTIALGESPCALFCCTDGILEAMNPDHKEFGHDRTCEVLRTRSTLDPGRIIDEVRRAVKEFTGSAPQSDDITMLALRLGP